LYDYGPPVINKRERYRWWDNYLYGIISYKQERGIDGGTTVY